MTRTTLFDVTARSSSTAETSVGRALRVVEAVADAGDGVTAKAIARRLRFTLPTTYRLLSTLVAEGYLVRLHDLRGYGLGYRIGELAHRLTDQVALPGAVRAIVHDVHRTVCGVAYYAVFRDDQVVVAHLEHCPSCLVEGPLRVGEPAAAHALAAGKVLLAGLDRRRLAGMLGEPLGRFTPRTVVDTAELCRQLELVREVGLATEVDELSLGRAGLAAPVRAGNGTVTGALGVSVSRVDFAARRVELELTVREGARRAAEALAERVAVG